MNTLLLLLLLLWLLCIFQDLCGKEVIVAEVSSRYQQLTQQCYWGPKLVAKLGLEAYLRK